jgi:hypothetical protein
MIFFEKENGIMRTKFHDPFEYNSSLHNTKLGNLDLDTTAIIKLNRMEGLEELNNLVLSDIAKVSKIVCKQAIQN